MDTLHIIKPLILITEDNKPMRELLDVLLKDNYSLVFKNDGLSAMKWLARGNSPVIILSGFKLPIMNGFDFLKILAQSGMFAHIPFIMISSKTDFAFKIECLEIGAKGFLEKPFNPIQLHELLDSILQEKVELRRN